MATRSGPRSGPTKYTLKLTAEQLNLIGKAIDELPHREARPLVAEIQNQISRQTLADIQAQTAS